MKTQTNLGMSFKKYAGFFSIIALALVMSMSLTGCGKKKKGRGAPGPAPVVVTPGGGYYGCAACGGGGQFIKSALGFNRNISGQPRFELALEFYSSSQASPSGGPVFAYGTLRVNGNDALNPCIPPGDYQVRSYQGQPGQMTNSNDSFAIALEGVGPTQVMIELRSNYFFDESPPMMGSDGRTYPFSMWNPMFITAASCGNTWGKFQLTN